MSFGVEILNPDLRIATLNEEANLEMELVAKVGRGYVPADRNTELELGTQFIPMDALFSPIRKCTYHVEKTRVGDLTDYDKLVLEVTTDGTVAPVDAVAYAAKILKDNLQIFIHFEEEEEELPFVPEVDVHRQALIDNLRRSVEELELSVRSYNCLKNAKIGSLFEPRPKDRGRDAQNAQLRPQEPERDPGDSRQMGLSLGMDLSQLKVSPEELRVGEKTESG